MAAETYPDDLRYHREHDWARVVKRPIYEREG